MLILTADWHADDGPWGKYPDLVGDVECSLNQVVDFALEHQVQGLLAAGDLYNTPNPSTSAQYYVHRQMDRLAAAMIPVYYIEGQHERSPRLPRLAAHHWPVCLHQRQAELDGIKIYGLSWQPADRLQEALAQIPPDTDMLMCHQVWAEQMSQLAGVREMEGRLEDIPRVPYVLTGDFHYHQTFSIPVPGSQAVRQIFSPGSLSVRRIDEEHTKAFFTFTRMYDAVLVDSVPLQTRPIHVLSVSTEAELEVLEQTAFAANTLVPEPIRKPIVIVFYDTAILNVYARLQDKFRNWAFLMPKPVTTQGTPLVIDPAERRERVPLGMVECLKLHVGEDSQEHANLRRLLSVSDPAVELQAIEEEFFTEQV